jgi:hypothetical protein
VSCCCQCRNRRAEEIAISPPPRADSASIQGLASIILRPTARQAQCSKQRLGEFCCCPIVALNSPQRSGASAALARRLEISHLVSRRLAEALGPEGRGIEDRRRARRQIGDQVAGAGTDAKAEAVPGKARREDEAGNCASACR